MKKPNDLTAETALIGSILIDPDIMQNVSEIIRTDDFYDDDCANVYEALCTIYDNGDEMDFVTIGNVLQRMGKFEKMGGNSFLTEVQENTPDADNYRQYMNIVVDMADRREVIEVASTAIKKAKDVKKPCQDAVTEICNYDYNDRLSDGDRTVSDIVDDVGEELLKEYPPLGFPSFDKLGQGVAPGDLVVIGALPSVGKSMFGIFSQKRFANF